MLSKVAERPRLVVFALIASATALALLVCQLTLRKEFLSWIRLPVSSSPIPSRSQLFSPNYTAAVVYLAQAVRLDDTLHSLGSLQLNIPWHSQWPIILFHTGDFDDHQVLAEFYTKLEKNKWTKTVHSKLRQRIEFVNIEFTFPAGVSPDINVYKPEVFDFWWPGYQHMCRFFAEQIFHHPRIRNLTYYMRMDTDSFIMKPVCYDPIDHIHRRNRLYAYNRITPDEGYVVRGMWNFIDRYAWSHPGVEDQLRRNKWPWPPGREKWILNGVKYDGVGVPAYSNNFEIVKLKAFQRRDVAQFIKEIMLDPGHIYNLRWGDAPIRGATISMFFDIERDVERMCGMEYYHQGLVPADCKCIP